MSEIRFRATRRAGSSTCRVMEYDDGQTWIAAGTDGAWWRTPWSLTDVDRILGDAPLGDRVLDVMRRVVPHYNPHLDHPGRATAPIGSFLRAGARVQTQRGWAVTRTRTG